MVSNHRPPWPDDFLQPPSVRRLSSRRSLLPGRVSPTKESTRGPVNFFLEILETALVTIMVLVVVRLVVVNYRVEGQSMAPTLHHQQYLLIDRISYLTIDASWAQWWPLHGRCERLRCSIVGTPQRGDIVVFWPPTVIADRPYIKRIIGLPGERVEVRGGQVLINGVRLAETYIATPALYEIEAATVAEGHYFVLGDNRNNSTDSHVFGVVAIEQVIGRAWLSYWPLDQFGLVLPTGERSPPAAQARIASHRLEGAVQ